MRSMFSGVSGLRAHQLKMDVIGNNIANVNTVGFKGQRANFQEVFSQTIKGAGSPQLGRGGTNPQQIGLGISLSSVDTFHVRGAVQRTDNNTDLAINGDGFFILSNSNDFLSRAYTRAGNFTLDEDGNLVASNGYRVLGYMEDELKNTGDKPVLKGTMEGLVISKSKSFPAMETDKATFTGNLNNNLTKLKAGDTVKYTTKTKSTKVPPIAELEFPTGVEYRETTSTFYDSLGGQHNIKFIFVRGIKGLSKSATGDDGVVQDKDSGSDSEWGVIVQNLETGTFFSTDSSDTGEPNITQIIRSISFDSDGKLTGATQNLKLTIPGKNGSSEFDVDVDLSQLTAFSNESSASVSTKNGYKQGYLDTFSIGPTGEIYGIFTNGQSRVIGQVALAAFKNPSGLEKTSENMYQVTPNSGDAIYGLPGSSGLGALNPGTLEMSNVDISREFTEMISTQRGFQANSRIITTSDEMLQELVNMKR